MAFTFANKRFTFITHWVIWVVFPMTVLFRDNSRPHSLKSLTAMILIRLTNYFHIDIFCSGMVCGSRSCVDWQKFRLIRLALKALPPSIYCCPQCADVPFAQWALWVISILLADVALRSALLRPVAGIGTYLRDMTEVKASITPFKRQLLS